MSEDREHNSPKDALMLQVISRCTFYTRKPLREVLNHLTDYKLN